MLVAFLTKAHCGHCDAVRPELVAAAELLDKDGGVVALVEADADQDLVAESAAGEERRKG